MYEALKWLLKESQNNTYERPFQAVRSSTGLFTYKVKIFWAQQGCRWTRTPKEDSKLVFKIMPKRLS